MNMRATTKLRQLVTPPGDRLPPGGARRRDGAAWLIDAIREARADGTLGGARLSDLLSRVLAHGHSIRLVYNRGGWVNVNDLADLVDASGL